jgi:putative sterol carrier protein
MPPAMPKDAPDLFDNIIPNMMSKFPDKAREVNAIYTFKITGDGGGEWVVDCVSNPPQVKKGDDGTGQCTIEITHDDFKTMLGDPTGQVGMQLYFQGKLRVTGDPMLAMKLSQLLSAARDSQA